MVQHSVTRKTLLELCQLLYRKKLCTKYSYKRLYTSRRAVYYVPGVNEKKLDSAFSLKVDCVVMDCENCVPTKEKNLARETIRSILDKDWAGTECYPERCIRINPVIEPEYCESDIDSLLSAKNLPGSIYLPKVNHVDHLSWFSERVWKALIKRPDNKKGPLKLLMSVESALAVMNLQELCQKAEELSTMAPVVLAALVFGNEDLNADLGATKTVTGLELLYARQKLVLIAKAFGLQAIDQSYSNIVNMKQFESECEDGKKMGFTGKQVIHPNQITTAQDIFTPSNAHLKWANRVLLDARKKSIQESKDIPILENSMINVANIRRAKGIYETARVAGKLKSNEEKGEVQT